MVKVFSNYGFDQNGLNLNNVYNNAWNYGLLDDYYVTYNGVTYRDVYIVEWYSQPTYYASAFAGNTITVDSSQIVSGGTITAYLELFWNGSSYIESWGIQEAVISATSLFYAATTPTTSDDYTIINAALAGSDAFNLSEYSDTAYGLGGNDTLKGNGGNDNLSGGDGNDVLLGGLGNDVLYGGNGNDILNGGSLNPSRSDGADAFHGGAGTDTVSYAGSRGSLRVDMVYSSINTFSAKGDTFDSIENLIGSQGADNLRGTTGDNRIEGNENVDYIFGRKGDDTLAGGIGDDVLFGGVGADTLIGGEHMDRAQYSESLTALTLDLLDPTRNTGEAAGDSYSGIEDLAGSEFSDEIFGNNGANRLFGRGGDDRLTGRAGNDYLNGGGGQDVLLGGAGDDVLRGGASRDKFVFDGGADVVEDYFLDELRLDASLWGNTALSDAQILSTYASVVGGDTVFDFGAGNTLTLQGHTDIAGLDGYISVF